jgi:hypothetical protein
VFAFQLLVSSGLQLMFAFVEKSEGDSWFLLLLSAVFQQLPRAFTSMVSTGQCFVALFIWT